MFWGAIVKTETSLKSKRIFRENEYPALNLSQALLVQGGNKENVLLKVQESP